MEKDVCGVDVGGVDVCVVGVSVKEDIGKGVGWEERSVDEEYVDGVSAGEVGVIINVVLGFGRCWCSMW